MAMDLKEYQSQYRKDNKERLQSNSKAWREKNKEKIKAGRAARYIENKAEILSAQKKSREDNPQHYATLKKANRAKNLEKIREQERASAKRNRETRRKRAAVYVRERRAKDPIQAVKDRLRARLGLAFRNNGYTRKSTLGEILGCSWEELKLHMESMFLEGMCWANRSEWHIDHIVPLATAKNEADLMALSHYTNLQPLWALDNLKKSAKL